MSKTERENTAVEGDENRTGESMRDEASPVPSAEMEVESDSMDSKEANDLGEAGESGDLECSADDGEANYSKPIEVSELEGRIAELEEALEESRDQYVRGQAEVENMRRRAQRDVENAHKFGIERFVGEMLPILDSMEMALEAAGQEGATVETIAEGTELTLKMLLGALEKFDVVAIDPEKQPFDPDLHQAMSMKVEEGVEPGVVVQVFQKGYSLSGRLVRPAMVVVSQ